MRLTCNYGDVCKKKDEGAPLREAPSLRITGHVRFHARVWGKQKIIGTAGARAASLWQPVYRAAVRP